MPNRFNDYLAAIGIFLSIIGIMFLPFNGVSPKSHSAEVSVLTNSGMTQTYGLYFFISGAFLVILSSAISKIEKIRRNRDNKKDKEG